MDEDKKDKKNNLPVIIAAIGAALLIPAFFLLKNFFFSADGGGAGADRMNLENLKAVGERIKTRKSMEILDTAIFEDQRFNALRAYDTKEFDLKDLQVGKENPFAK